MLRLLITYSRLILVSCLAFVLFGCATSATYEAMTPAGIDSVKKHDYTIAVKVTGGHETNPLWLSQIPNESYSLALIEAINKSRLFSKAMQGANSDYILTVMLLSSDSSSSSLLNSSLKLETGWILKHRDTGKLIWQEVITGEHTATFDDAFVGVTRFRMATEGAARKSIEIGLNKISQLSM